eukprot:6212577-Pleurochrysis_carterae.AAC.3
MDAATTHAQKVSVMCERGACSIPTKPVNCFRSARLHREDRGKKPSGSRCRHALLGINSRT